jgi:hypothetical protein
VLHDAASDDHTIWAVYPTARQVLPKVRMFIAELEALLSEASDLKSTKR